MKCIGKISYLSELFGCLSTPLNEIASGEFNERGLMRRYQMVARVLRQISETADTLAEVFEEQGNEALEPADSK